MLEIVSACGRAKVKTFFALSVNSYLVGAADPAAERDYEDEDEGRRRISRKSARGIAFEPVADVGRFFVCRLELQNFLVMFARQWRLMQFLVVHFREPKMNMSVGGMALQNRVQLVRRIERKA